MGCNDIWCRPSWKKEPLWWVITTAGDDPDRKSIGWEIHDMARRIADGEIYDPTWYVKIYSAREDADILTKMSGIGQIQVLDIQSV